MADLPQKPAPEGPAPSVKQLQKNALWSLASAGTEFAFYIAGPLLLFALFIQPKFNPGGRSKLFTILGLLACLALSALAVGKTINAYKKKLK